MYKPNRNISTAVIDNPPQPNQWGIRAKNIERAVTEYMDRYKFGNLWSESIKGDWDIHLVRYVAHVAQIQAEIIYEDKVGYSTGIIWGYASYPAKEKIREFFDEQRRLCASGSIDVHIPAERIEYFKKYPVPRTALFV